MTFQTNQEFLESTVKLHGKQTKTMIAIEEMGELMKELSKNFRGKENTGYIAEEIADVTLMMAQLCVAYDISEYTIQKIMNDKTTRQRWRDHNEVIERRAKQEAGFN